MSFSPILLLHACAGTLGLLSGALALSFRKGSRRHRIAGNIFFISMLGLGVTGAYIGVMKSQIGNVFGGTLTAYLVATAWLTARRRDGKTGIFDWVAPLVPLVVGAVMVIGGFEAAHSGTGSKAGVPAGMYFFLGSVALLAAAGDIRMLARGVFGAQRIARHLWRMCFALFIAAGSFFLGPANRPLRFLSALGVRQQLFAAVLGKTSVLILLSVLPLLLMIFWLLRVRFTNAYKRRSMPSGGDVYSLGT